MSQMGEVAGVNMKKWIVGDISATVNNKIVKPSQSHAQLSEKYKIATWAVLPWPEFEKGLLRSQRTVLTTYTITAIDSLNLLLLGSCLTWWLLLVKVR